MCTFFPHTLPPPPPLTKWGVGGGLLASPCPSVFLPVCPAFVRNIFSWPLNPFVTFFSFFFFTSLLLFLFRYDVADLLRWPWVRFDLWFGVAFDTSLNATGLCCDLHDWQGAKYPLSSTPAVRWRRCCRTPANRYATSAFLSALASNAATLALLGAHDCGSNQLLWLNERRAWSRRLVVSRNLRSRQAYRVRSGRIMEQTSSWILTSRQPHVVSPAGRIMDWAGS